MKYIRDLELSGKYVLIRVDLNVPFGEGLVIRDDGRIKQAMPTIKSVMEQGGFPVLVSHLGDPEERRDALQSLRPVALHLRQLLGADIRFSPECIGSEVKAAVKGLEPGQVLVLENLFFHPGEKTNDHAFCQQLAQLADVYINDAFPSAHQRYASIVGTPRLFRERAAGLAFQRELEFYYRAVENPKSPLCVALGGSKVSTKLNLLLHLAHKADKLIIGGAMANTFLAAQGIQMGRSRFEQELFPKILETLGGLARRECKVYLPVDFMVGRSPSEHGLARAVPAQELPADLMALDIGPASSILFREALQSAETIVWNGPLGTCENEDFSKGTTDFIESVAGTHALKVAGGVDTETAIRQMQLEHKFDFISSGGQAFVSLLEGKGLPAVAALEG